MPSTLLLGVATVVAALIALSFVIEYIDERDAGVAAVTTGQRARSATERAATAGRYGILGLAGLGASLAMEMLQLATGLNEILGGAPVILGHLLFGIITFLGLEGVIPLSKMMLGWTFVTITIVALILRFSDDGGDDD